LSYLCSPKKDGALIAAGAICGLASFAVENSLHPLTEAEIAGLSPETINRFDRDATLHYGPGADNASDVVLAAIMAAPLGLLSTVTVRKEITAFTSMYVETLLFSYTLPALGKGITARNRPYVYNPAVPVETKTTKDSRASFFSRHTTTAFASSVFLSTLYDGYFPQSSFGPYLWGISLLGASAVGVMRYQAGAHFPTDILTGAAVGTIIGYGIPRLHAGPRKNGGLACDPFRRAVYCSWKI